MGSTIIKTAGDSSIVSNDYRTTTVYGAGNSKQSGQGELPPPFDSLIWFDISDLTTLFQDVAGTVPVTAVGDPVGLIMDKSGFDNHASQSVSTKRPTLQIDLYGQYYLQFDGVDDILATQNIDLSTTDSLYIFTHVGKETSTTSVKVIIEQGNGALPTNSFFVADTTLGIRLSSGGSIGNAAAYLPYLAAPFERLLSFNMSINQDHIIGVENGVQILNNNSEQGIGYYSNAPIYIGSRATSLFSEVKLYQVILRKKESSLPQIRSIDRYFNAGNQSIQYQQLSPNDARLLVSDYVSITEQSSSRLRFIRSLTEANNYKHCSPGSRVGLSTNAKAVKFTVYYNDLVTREDARNYVGELHVDGVLVQTFTNPNPTTTAEVTIEKSYTTNTTRKYELVWPYGDGMDLLSIGVSVDATTIELPAARPATKLQFFGDSITHGFSATSVSETWAYKTALAKNYQLINSGYGSLWANATYGNMVAASDAIVVVLGMNNYLSQQALATFKTAYKSMLQNIRTTLPTAKIYVVTPFFSTSALTIPLSDYRTQESDAVAEIADGNTVFIDGLTMMTNSSNRLQDGIHPNNTGSAEIATNLAALIT